MVPEASDTELQFQVMEGSLKLGEVDVDFIALEDLKEIAQELADVSTVEQMPSMEGRTMTMVLAPSHAPRKKTPVPATKTEDSPV